MSQIQITLPNEPKDTIDSVIYLLKADLGIKNMILLSGTSSSLIIIRTAKKYIPTIMERLSEIGVGVDFGIIDILSLNATKPDLTTESNQTKISPDEELRSRISLEEIKKNVSEVSSIDINYIIFITLAALVAGAGLMKNSTVILIASMLLSPLMGSILSVSYGIVIKDKQIIKRGVKGQLIGMGISLLCGILMGAFTLIFIPNPEPTQEMLLRDYPTFLDIVVAVSGGFAVGFCMTGSIQSALVGIAIAVSLLPPVVNTGILMVLGEWNHALGSLTLTLTNVAVINICAILVFKLKRIESLPLTAYDWKGPEEKITIVVNDMEKRPTSLKTRIKNIFRFGKKSSTIMKTKTI